MNQTKILEILQETSLLIGKHEALESKLSNHIIMLGSILQVMTYEDAPVTKEDEGKMTREVIKNVQRIQNEWASINQDLKDHIEKAIQTLKE